MLHPGRDPNLAEKPLPSRCAKVRFQNLDCDEAIVLEVAREVDGRHPANTDLTFNLVAARELAIVVEATRSHVSNAVLTIGALPPEKQEQVLEFVDSLVRKSAAAKPVEPCSALREVAKLNLDGPPDASTRFHEYLYGENARESK